MNDIVQIISTVGFPIVAVLGMSYFFMIMWKAQNEQNIRREEELMNIVRDLSGKLADLGRIVDENTKMLVVLSEKIESVENKIEGN